MRVDSVMIEGFGIWMHPMVKNQIPPVSHHACCAYFTNPSVHYRAKDIHSGRDGSMKVIMDDQ